MGICSTKQLCSLIAGVEWGGGGVSRLCDFNRRVEKQYDTCYDVILSRELSKYSIREDTRV